MTDPLEDVNGNNRPAKRNRKMDLLAIEARQVDSTHVVCGQRRGLCR